MIPKNFSSRSPCNHRTLFSHPGTSRCLFVDYQVFCTCRANEEQKMDGKCRAGQDDTLAQRLYQWFSTNEVQERTHVIRRASFERDCRRFRMRGACHVRLPRAAPGPRGIPRTTSSRSSIRRISKGSARLSKSSPSCGFRGRSRPRLVDRCT